MSGVQLVVEYNVMSGVQLVVQFNVISGVQLVVQLRVKSSVQFCVLFGVQSGVVSLTTSWERSKFTVCTHNEQNAQNWSIVYTCCRCWGNCWKCRVQLDVYCTLLTTCCRCWGNCWKLCGRSAGCTLGCCWEGR